MKFSFLVALLLAFGADAKTTLYLESGDEIEGELTSITTQALGIRDSARHRLVPLKFIIAVRKDSLLLGTPINWDSVAILLNLARAQPPPATPTHRPHKLIRTREGTMANAPMMVPMAGGGGGGGGFRMVGGGSTTINIRYVCSTGGDSAAKCDDARRGEIDSLLASIPESAALSRKSGLMTVTTFALGVAAPVCIATAYNRPRKDVSANALYTVGIGVIPFAITSHILGSYWGNKAVRVYNEEAEIRARISMIRSGLELALRF